MFYVFPKVLLLLLDDAVQNVVELLLSFSVLQCFWINFFKTQSFDFSCWVHEWTSVAMIDYAAVVFFSSSVSFYWLDWSVLGKWRFLRSLSWTKTTLFAFGSQLTDDWTDHASWPSLLKNLSLLFKIWILSFGWLQSWPDLLWTFFLNSCVPRLYQIWKETFQFFICIYATLLLERFFVDLIMRSLMLKFIWIIHHVVTLSWLYWHRLSYFYKSLSRKFSSFLCERSFNILILFF